MQQIVRKELQTIFNKKSKICLKENLKPKDQCQPRQGPPSPLKIKVQPV